MSRRAARSFTLIEVLITIALVMALVGSMFGFFLDMLKSRALAVSAVKQQDALAALMRQLDSDLSTCIVGDRSTGSGVEGDGESLKILSRGVAGGLAQRGADDPHAFGDLQFTEYRYEYENDAIEMTRAPGGRGGAALGKTDWLDGPMYRVRFRYHDGHEWKQSFNSLSEGHLPVAVEVSIWLSPLPGESVEAEPAAASDADQRSATAGTRPSSRPEVRERLSAASQPERAADEPPPDRQRVFLVPDAAADARAAGSGPSETDQPEARP